MLVDPKMIPPEVVEAAARAITMALVLAVDDDTRALALTEDERAELARAAIAAALNAWPGVRMMVDIDTGDDSALKLPLPQEKSDD